MLIVMHYRYVCFNMLVAYFLIKTLFCLKLNETPETVRYIDKEKYVQTLKRVIS